MSHIYLIFGLFFFSSNRVLEKMRGGCTCLSCVYSVRLVLKRYPGCVRVRAFVFGFLLCFQEMSDKKKTGIKRTLK